MDRNGPFPNERIDHAEPCGEYKLAEQTRAKQLNHLRRPSQRNDSESISNLFCH